MDPAVGAAVQAGVLDVDKKDGIVDLCSQALLGKLKAGVKWQARLSPQRLLVSWACPGGQSCMRSTALCATLGWRKHARACAGRLACAGQGLRACCPGRWARASRAGWSWPRSTTSCSA